MDFRLPDDVCLVEEPQLARWDSSRMCWRTDGIADAAVNIEDRTLSFKTVHFGPIGLFIVCWIVFIEQLRILL